MRLAISAWNGVGTPAEPPSHDEEDPMMRALLVRSYVRLFPLCLLLMMAGCDDDDWESRDVINVVFAVGDVVLAIIRAIAWF